jgi:hypothetical protein
MQHREIIVEAECMRIIVDRDAQRGTSHTKVWTHVLRVWRPRPQREKAHATATAAGAELISTAAAAQRKWVIEN